MNCEFDYGDQQQGQFLLHPTRVECKVCGWAMDGIRMLPVHRQCDVMGIGDAVARLAKLMRIAETAKCGCVRRREVLNRATQIVVGAARGVMVNMRKVLISAEG